MEVKKKWKTKIYNILIYIYIYIYIFIDKNILDNRFGSVWFGLNPNQTKPFGLSKT